MKAITAILVLATALALQGCSAIADYEVLEVPRPPEQYKPGQKWSLDLPGPTQPAAPDVPTLETEATPGSAVTLTRISETWPQVLSMVRQRNPQTQGLLNSCKPMGFKSGNLILALPLRGSQ